jgi:amino acid transporter
MRIPGAVRFVTAARAAHAVYGSIIVLAVLTGLDEVSATSREAFFGVLGAAIAVALSEMYADMIGATIRERRTPTRDEYREFVVDMAFGFGAALFPALFFLLAWLGVMELGNAFTVAEWSGIGILFCYGLVAARAANLRLTHSLLWAAGLTVCGIGLVELKKFAGH